MFFFFFSLLPGVFLPLCTSGLHRARQTREPARSRGLQRLRLGHRQPPPKMVCNNCQEFHHNNHPQQRMVIAAILTSANIIPPPPPRGVLFLPQALLPTPLLLPLPMKKKRPKPRRSKLPTKGTKEEDWRQANQTIGDTLCRPPRKTKGHSNNDAHTL